MEIFIGNLWKISDRNQMRKKVDWLLYHEQYWSTLFFRKTSNKSFVASVSGNHPGTLMSKFFWAALWLKTSSNLLTNISYLCLSSLSSLFLSSIYRCFSLSWCFIVLVLFVWIPFNSSICFFLFLSMSWIWFLIKLLSSFSLASHLIAFSLNSLLSSLSLFSASSLLRSLDLISSSFVWRLFWSCLMIWSFSSISSCKFLRFVWYCLSLSSAILFESSDS